MRQSSRPISGPLNAAMSALAQRLGLARLPRLMVCDRVMVPTVIGGFRSAILLPASVVSGVSAQMLEALLAHELCHLKRHDYLVNLWQSAVETVLFYHPAVWWVSKAIREQREYCCDDMAVTLLNDGATYARALATMEEMRSQPLMLAASDGDLIARIRRIVSPGPRRDFSVASTLFALALPAAIVIALAATSIRLAAPTIAAARQPHSDKHNGNQSAPCLSRSAVTKLATLATQRSSPTCNADWQG
jgi:beta-lactamase regulating signal transducer with metallopeptidase domain